MGKTGFENGQSFQDSSVYNPIKGVPTPGSNLIVDPGFENWLNFYILDSWGNSGTNIQQSTDVPSGLGLNYSAYFSTSGYIYTGYGNGSGTVNTTLWARTGATGTIYFTASYQDNSINYHWNWTGTNAGTYTSNYAPTETVTNGGFEIWTEEYPDTWYFFGDGTCTKETSKVHSGTNAAKITCTTNLSYIDSDLQFSMNIPVGSTVNISLWVAGDAGGETAGFVLYGDNGTVQMAWDWSLNDFTSCPADPTGNQILPLSSLTTSYQNFTQAITYTATYSGSLSPRLYGSASGTVYFDVISIQAMQDQGANSDQKYYPTLTTSWTQFTIPGFDYNSGDNEIRLISDTGNVYVTLVDPESTGGSGLTLTDWIELSHGTNEVSQSTDSHTGTYAAQLNGTTGNDSGLVQSYTSAPGTGYTLSLWGKGASTSIQVAYTDNALQSAYNFTGTYAGTYTAMSGGPTSDQLATINFTGTYANYTLSAVPPYSSSSFALVIFSEDVCVVDTLTLKDQSGNDISVDGDFELWSTAPMISNGNMNTWDATPSNTLADWTQATTDPGFDEGSVNRETTVIHSGSCAVKIISSPSNSHSQRIFEEVHGTAGSPATFKVWATNNGSVGNGQLSFEDGTEIWNFVTLGWDAIGDKGANNVQELVATSAYTQFVFNLTFPASGMIEPMLTTYGFTGSAGTIYYDDAELKEVSPAPLIDAVVLENDSNLGDLLTGDTAFRVHFKGDNKDALRITPDGQLQTDITGGLQVGVPTTAGNIANKFYVDNLNVVKPLTSALIDCTAVASSLLVSNTSSKTMVVTGIYLRPQSVDTPTVGGAASFGTNSPDYNNYFSSSVLESSLPVGSFAYYSPTSAILVPPSAGLYINITIGITATAYTALFDVVGYLVDNLPS